MTAPAFSESDVETAALEWLRTTDWQVTHGQSRRVSMGCSSRSACSIASNRCKKCNNLNCRD